MACFGMLVAASPLPAKEPPAPGTTRAAVIAQYGPPSGSVQVGAREILSYREGRVVLVNGVVKEFNSAGDLEVISQATGYAGTPAPKVVTNESREPATRTPGTRPPDTPTTSDPTQISAWVMVVFMIGIRMAIGRMIRRR